jgi:Flp pilus assembly protein TadG
VKRLDCGNQYIKQQGQSLVEFAIIMPLLLALLLAIIEIALVLHIYVGLTNTVREVARAGAMYQYDPDSAPSATPSLASLDAERTTAMEQELAATLNPLIDTASLNPVAERYSYTPAVPANNYRYSDRLAVTLEYQHALAFGVLGRTITLRASSEMRLEPGGR